MSSPNHQARTHSRLGGSLASIFTVCTGAPALWAGRERRSTAFTREGTAAHELSDALLRSGRSDWKQALLNMPSTGVLIEGEPVEITDEMRAGVAGYVELVHALMLAADWYRIEQSFTLDALWLNQNQIPPEPLYGSADFVAVSGAFLVVLDLKFGKGVPVDPEGNAQLLYYALGAYLTLCEQDLERARRITHVRIGICQPRVKDEPTWWDIPLLDLILWGDDTLKSAVDTIAAGTGTVLVSGKHCQFCVAKGICPELQHQANQTAKGLFPPPAPATLSDQELGEILQRAEIISIWVNAVRAELETRIKNGTHVPGWKLVDKRGYRQWTDPTDVTAWIATAGVDPAMFMSEPELLSPAQVEKKLKLLAMNPRALDQFIVAPIAGTTLVPETDKRPAVVTGASNVFTDVQDSG